MAYLLAAYFLVGWLIDYIISRAGAEQWSRECDVPLWKSRIMTMFLWGILLPIGVVLLLIDWLKGKL